MEIKDLVREKILVEIIAERAEIILNQQKVIEDMKKEVESLKLPSAPS